MWVYCWIVGNEGMRYPISYIPLYIPFKGYIVGHLIPSFPTNQQYVIPVLPQRPPEEGGYVFEAVELGEERGVSIRQDLRSR